MQMKRTVQYKLTTKVYVSGQDSKWLGVKKI